MHPDRVEEDVKAEATEKFKVLGRIYATLQDEEKRKVYDENGEFDDDADSNCNWMEYWRNIFKPITEEQIEAHKKEYINSEAEIRDIKKAYINGKGDMNFIHDAVPFVDCESEPRIMEIVRRLIDAGEVEEYDGFFNEPKRKKERRRRKYEEERKLCDEMRGISNAVFTVRLSRFRNITILNRSVAGNVKKSRMKSGINKLLIEKIGNTFKICKYLGK